MMSHSLPLACATCANNFQEAGGDAAGWAILFMVGVIVSVASGVIFCIMRIAKREQAALDPQFFDE